jgi:hypothetical protein
VLFYLFLEFFWNFYFYFIFIFFHEITKKPPETNPKRNGTSQDGSNKRNIYNQIGSTGSVRQFKMVNEEVVVLAERS